MADRKAYKIILTDEQPEALEIVGHMNEWDLHFEEVLGQNEDPNYSVETNIVAVPATSDVNEDVSRPRVARQEPKVDVWADAEAEECIYCFLRPCVTTHRQGWLGAGRAASLANRVTRKTLYKQFWSVMEHRGAWYDPRYMGKKEAAILETDQEEHIVWTTGPKARQSVREIMPECILKLVRGLYPNPPGVSYMGHIWH